MADKDAGRKRPPQTDSRVRAVGGRVIIRGDAVTQNDDEVPRFVTPRVREVRRAGQNS
jgi:hypothetical protein